MLAFQNKVAPRRSLKAISLGTLENLIPAFGGERFSKCPREESNPYQKLRKLPSYPLNDEGVYIGLTITLKLKAFNQIDHWQKFNF